MNAVSCRWVKARLPLFAGGDLAGHDRLLVQRHVRTCSKCAGHLNAHTASMGVLEQVAEIAPSGSSRGSLWDDLRIRISEERRESVLRLPDPVWRAVPRWAIAAALVVASLGAGYGVWRFSPYRLNLGLPPRIVDRRLPQPVIHPPITQANPRPGETVATTTGDDSARAQGDIDRGEPAQPTN